MNTESEKPELKMYDGLSGSSSDPVNLVKLSSGKIEMKCKT
jgi:hypothetical protein